MKKLLTLILFTAAFGLQAKVPQVPSIMERMFDALNPHKALEQFNSTAVTVEVTQPVIQPTPVQPVIQPVIPSAPVQPVIETPVSQPVSLPQVSVIVERLKNTDTGFSAAVKRFSETATATGERVSVFYKDVIVPVSGNAYAIVAETGSAAKDLGRLITNGACASGKFLWDHFPLTVSVGIAAGLYILWRAASGEIVVQYNKLQDFIDNTLAEVSQFDISADNISREKGKMLWACDLYLRTTKTFGIGARVYQAEVQAIDNFFRQVTILKGHITTRQSQHLVDSQVREVRKAAAIVQFMLAKSLNLYTVQSLMARR